MKKKCYKCKTEKRLEDFNNASRTKDGKQSSCRDCQKKYTRDNREAIARKGKVYREKNKESVAATKKAYYEANKERVADYQKQWQTDNRERVNKWNRDRRANNPAHKMLHRMRIRMQHALNGQAKLDTTIKLVGCTPEQLRDHLESQFVEGMAWGQKGLWHIDHTLPCAAFDLTKKKHQRYCFHWSNLSPLWAADNLAKADKYDPEELERYLKSKLPTYDYAK